MRVFIYSMIAALVAIIVICHGFMFAVNYVFYDYIHNVDVDGSRGREMLLASIQAQQREEYYEKKYGENFTIWSGIVERVIDGDTIVVRLGGERRKIRLHGIDCPEKGQDFGTATKKSVADLVEGKRVDVIDLGRDKYGRTLAVVEVDGVNLNEALLAEGLAWVYRQYNDDAEWQALEAEARSARRGLWSMPEPVPPWEWRRERKHPISPPEKPL